MEPVRHLAVNGVEIGYQQVGAGRDLLVVTGNACTMGTWGTTFPHQLSTYFRVTMFDNRGAGRSTDDQSVPMTIQLLAADTVGLIGALALRRPDVLGWSMGAEIALAMAVDHEAAIGRLVTTGGDTGGRHAVPASPRVQDMFNDPNPTIDQFLDVFFPPGAEAARKRYTQEYRSIPQAAVPAETVRRQGEAETAFHLDERTWRGLADVQTPILVTNGSEDVVNPPANADVIVNRVGSGRVEKVIFDGAGHAMWFQALDRFVDLVVEFLEPHRR